MSHWNEPGYDPGPEECASCGLRRIALVGFGQKILAYICANPECPDFQHGRGRGPMRFSDWKNVVGSEGRCGPLPSPEEKA